MVFEQLVEKIKGNYKNYLNGIPNHIPIGFQRFQEYLPGIVKSNYTIITASSGVGKSKFTRHYYINNVLAYTKAFQNVKPIIIVFSLELSAEEYIADIICGFLEKDYNVKLSYRQLLSIEKESKVNEQIISYVESYKDFIELFNKYVRIYTSIKNPYGIYKKVKDIITVTVKGQEVITKDNEGAEVKFWKYEDDRYFVIPIIDHISLIQPEVNKETKQAMTLHQAMSKLSSDYLLTLKNYYQCHVIVVQQQAADKERVEHDFTGKSIQSKLEPSLDGLGDNKLTQRDATEVLGLFAPNRYDIQNHPQSNPYNIGILQDNYRSLKILKSRYTSPNKRIGLYFDGCIGYFEELPKAEDFNDRQTKLFLDSKNNKNNENKIEVKAKIKLNDVN